MNKEASAIPSDKILPQAVKEVVLEEKVIATRVRALGQELTRDYKDKELIVVAILKGAFIFACDLIRQMSLQVSLDFMAISRYTRHSKGGEVRILKDLQQDIARRHVLLLEDIVDTGLSLNYLVRILLARDPASLAICTLLDRPDLRLVEIPIKYAGFNVSHEFLIGYGLDYRGHYRNLPYLATMKIGE